MKYIDTNVIVRLITNDVPELAKEAIELIEKSETPSITLLDSVITEVCFVLEYHSIYKLPRSIIHGGLYALLDSGKFQTGTHTHEALDLYITYGKLDYVDCLLLASAHGKKASLLSFDKTLMMKAS